MKAHLGALSAALLASLVLTSVAVPATAGGALTKTAVRKLVTRTVATMAPTLAVAHAKTADTADAALTARTAQTAVTADRAGVAATAADADRLDGVDAAALQTRTVTYTAPARLAANGQYVWAFPGLDAGTYLVSLTILLESGATSTTNTVCELTDPTYSTDLLFGYGVRNGQYMVVSAAGAVSMSADDILSCGTTAPAGSSMSGSIDFTRIDNRSSRTATTP